MKIVKYQTVIHDDVHLSIFVDAVNLCIADGWQPIGGISHNIHLNLYIQAMVKYEEETFPVNYDLSQSISKFDDKVTMSSEKYESLIDEITNLKEGEEISEYENQAFREVVNRYEKENEQLKEKILFYESPLSQGELTYDELIKENKRLETIIEILVSNHCQELVSGETVMYFAGNLIKENGDSFEDDIYNIARKIIEKK